MACIWQAMVRKRVGTGVQLSPGVSRCVRRPERGVAVGVKEIMLSPHAFFLAAAVMTASWVAHAVAPPPPVVGAASAQRVAALQLQCAKIWLQTSSSKEPIASIWLDSRNAESGSADVYADVDLVRIEGQKLGESQRERFDYRYDHGQLVCSSEEHTSLHTLRGADSVPIASRMPPFWRVDTRVFDDGDAVRVRFDEAPGQHHFHRSPAETVAAASEIFALATGTLKTTLSDAAADAFRLSVSLADSAANAEGLMVRGALDVDIIRRVVKDHGRQLGRCAESGLKHTRRLVGRVDMKWVILGDGSVASAEVIKSAVPDLQVETCLAASIMTLRFPAPKNAGVVIVNYPLTFHQGG